MRFATLKTGTLISLIAILNVMAKNTLSTEVIHAAIEGFEAQKSRIDAQIAELRAMLSGATVDASVNSSGRATTRRKMSAAARKRIGDAQRKRWAASKGKASTTAKPKRKLSAAGRANIVAALKKRWAAKKSGLTVAKKAVPRKSTSKQAGPHKVATKAA